MGTFYRKIVIPLDGSALGERVLAHLPLLASPAETDLVLVSVVESWRYATAGGDFAIPSLIADVRSGAEAYIEQQRAHLQSVGYRVGAHIVDGDAAQTILATATEAGADLIAMSTHGHSGFVRWALGSVAERVIHETTLPVFLVRATTAVPSGKIQSIVVPLDGSANAEQALPAAQSLAQATGAHVLLLQVIQSMDEGSRKMLFADEAMAETTFAQWRTTAEHYLAQIAAQWQNAGVTTEYRVLFGDPDQTILQVVADETVDLIVMTTHGRTGIKRWFYGSVANKVLRGVSCPLLLVRNR